MESNPFEPPQTHPLSPREEKKKLVLSQSNKIYLTTVSLLLVILYVASPEMSPYMKGQAFGVLAQFAVK